MRTALTTYLDLMTWHKNYPLMNLADERFFLMVEEVVILLVTVPCDMGILESTREVCGAGP